MTAEVRVLRHSDLARCPNLILSPRHYREDGTCRCRPAPEEPEGAEE